VVDQRKGASLFGAGRRDVSNVDAWSRRWGAASVAHAVSRIHALNLD
jgi:hypothetical protein